MAYSRRNFLKSSLVTAGGLTIARSSIAGKSYYSEGGPMPVVISTWGHGMPANQAAWKILSKGGHSLDAAEAGVRVPEGDPQVITVGKGGIPDASGKVTLDACIIDEKGRAGAVTYLQHITHPVSVARLVMEKTPHVMLSGKGALKFALKNGFKKEKLLTQEQKATWKKWKKNKDSFNNVINIENHDTIGLLALDADGRLSGACTTSGMAYKLPGRVGDSPIIGAGLFVDGEVGAATATGSGELVMKTLGSFLVVELMRDGMPPRDACKTAVLRIAKKIPDFEKHQVGFIALDKNGNHGGFCIQPGFNYAVKNENFTGMVKVEPYFKSW